MNQIERIQEALRREHLDAWLFFDHHRRDPLAYRILQLPDEISASRRWYYLIPAYGEPRKLVHRIESATLDSLPGEKFSYSSWPDQQAKVNLLLAGKSRVAMQYSPNCLIPYISLVDAGTIELVRNTGVEVLSSADFVQEFESRWTDEQYHQHLAAGKLIDEVRRQAFSMVGQRLKDGVAISEYETQQFIRQSFEKRGIFTDHGPIVAVNANASDPHYEPSCERNSQIKIGDVLLIDLWGKLKEPGATYYDVTWTGFCGSVIPAQVQRVFEVVRDARVAACNFVSASLASGEVVAGYQVDDQARDLITMHGLGEFFFHRTGHSIGTEVHGTGANMDNLESHDDRKLISQTCFSVEPGVYLPTFGIRSEVDVYVGEGFGVVTGEQQQALVEI